MIKFFAVLLILTQTAAAVYAGGAVHTFTLSNGLTVLHKENTANPLVTIEAFARSGAIAEQKNQAGLASFTQGLLLQGTTTKNAEELAAAIDDLGAHISSDMEHDFASIGISVMDTNFAPAMAILAEIVLHPSFNEAEIEKERMNTLAGINSRKDQIHQVAHDLFNETFYDGHPYAWPYIGTEKTVSTFNRTAILAWHEEHYTAKNMLLVIAGNISITQAKTAAETYFSALPAGKDLPAFPQPALPGHQEIKVPAKKFNQAYLMAGFAAPAINSPDFPALKVMNALLGGRMTGRLFTELREKLSLAYEVSSFYPSRRMQSRFVVYMGLEAKNLDLAGKRIDEILAELTTTPVSAQELQDTKNYIKGMYLLDRQTINRQAWYAGWWEILGPGYQFEDKYIDTLMAVTVEDIQRVARTYFTRENYVKVVLYPSK